MKIIGEQVFVSELIFDSDLEVKAVIDIVKDKLKIGGTAVLTTAAELNFLDTAVAGTVVASKAVVASADKDIASFRNITLTGELDAGSLTLSTVLAVAEGGTGASNTNAILNSRITTSADGSLNYDATSAVAVSHDSLAGFVAAEHYDWSGDISSTATIHASNVPNATLAATATTVTVTDNEDENENNVITFVAGAAGSGNVGLEADGDLTYNPSTGKVTATGFVGALTGDVTGEADTVATIAGLAPNTAPTGSFLLPSAAAAQTNVTSLGTLTALTVDNVAINGTTIGHTSDTNLITVAANLMTVEGAIDAKLNLQVNKIANAEAAPSAIANKAIIFMDASGNLQVTLHNGSSSVTKQLASFS